MVKEFLLMNFYHSIGSTVVIDRNGLNWHALRLERNHEFCDCCGYMWLFQEMGIHCHVTHCILTVFSMFVPDSAQVVLISAFPSIC